MNLIRSRLQLLSKSENPIIWLLFLITLIVYGNSVFNDYALDDSLVITQNDFVKKGLSGIKDIFTTDSFTGFFKQDKELVQGGRYRPLSLATFAAEYSLWGLKPALSHSINVLIFGLLIITLLKTLKTVFRFLMPNQEWALVTFFGTLIFAVHPVHTEVVANIKGRDELLAVLFMLLSLVFSIRSLVSPSIKNIAAAGLLFFAALLSKENALALLAIFPVILLLDFRRTKFLRFALTLFVLIISASLYLIIRIRVTGGLTEGVSDELMNNPFLHADPGQKSATILYTLILYLKLLVFPHPLTYDYYPYHIDLREWDDIAVLFSLFLNAGLIALSIMIHKKNRFVAFGMLFYFITLLPVSNIFVNTGSFMNERFLFLPSVGFAIVAGWFAGTWLTESTYKWKSVFSAALLVLIIVTFSVKTIVRNTNWKDNFTLFTHDVKVSENSAKGNCAAGGILYETAVTLENTEKKEMMLLESGKYLEKALSIYPDYVDALLLSGNVQFQMNMNITDVLIYYDKLLILAPGHELTINNLKKMIPAVDTRQQIIGYKYILKKKPDDFESNYQLGAIYGKQLHELDSSIFFLKKAIALNQRSKFVNRDLGVAYAMKGMHNEALPYFEIVATMDPEDPDNFINLGMVYYSLGRQTDAEKMFAMAEQLKKAKLKNEIP